MPKQIVGKVTSEWEVKAPNNMALVAALNGISENYKDKDVAYMKIEFVDGTIRCKVIERTASEGAG